MSEPRRTLDWLLAIDTSTEQAGIALTDGTRTAETSWWAGRDQTVSVLPQIDRLIDLAGIKPGAVAAVAVATGPGMFNGLRVGMSIAKGWRLGSDADLIGVSTLAIAAEPCRGLGLPVIAVVAAGRGRLVWWIEGGDAPPVNGTVQELAEVCRELRSGGIVTGDLTTDQVDIVSGVPGVLVPPPPARLRRPGVLAALGWRRFAANDTDDPVALAPVYVHSASVSAQR